MASRSFARSAAASAFSRFHHRDWRETYDLTPAERRAMNTVETRSTQRREQHRSDEPTSSRHPMRMGRNPLRGQPRRIRPESEELESNFQPISLGQVVRESCETAVRRYRGRRRTDNSRWHNVRRSHHANDFESELHELDLEMLPRPGDAELLAA